MTVKKDFFIENKGTWDVYYKIYFTEVSGGLANVLDISIMDGDATLFSGTARELSKTNVKAANDVLKLGERRNLTIYFHYPEYAGNDTQNMYLDFTMAADATQTKNNPNRLFE